MDRTEELLSRIASLETTIMEQRQTIAKQRAIIEEFKSKEQSISSAIIASMEHANQLEASRKKLYTLDIQRSRLMYLRMEQIINELYARYPEISRDTNLRDMSEKFRTLVYKDLNDRASGSASFDIKKQPVDDPIRKLLHNIIDAFDTKKAPNDLRADANVDVMNVGVSKSGFDINEALHPTMELDEIMKAFDLGDKNKKK